MAQTGHLAVTKTDTMKPLHEGANASCHGPHDLLWSTGRKALISDEALPDWALSGRLAQAPVVVRREKPVRPGLIPVGLRGETRSQRFPAYIYPDAVLRVIRPETLARNVAWQNRLTLQHFRAVIALKELAPHLDATGLCWGPTGSTGYALATGLAVLHAQSDLDLVVRASVPLTPAQVAILLAATGMGSCRVDMQIDTGRGAFSFAEWASRRGRVLVKTDFGPLLAGDPWEIDDAGMKALSEPRP
jgi:phosphoribosyl-dephospho-CoA transferase